jgi:hypothetical protein
VSTDGSSVEGFSSGSVFGAQEFSARERDDGWFSGCPKTENYASRSEIGHAPLCSRQQATEQ